MTYIVVAEALVQEVADVLAEEQINIDITKDDKILIVDPDQVFDAKQVMETNQYTYELVRTVYVYKQFHDDYAYGEEIIELYEDKADAEAALKKDVEEGYGVPWDDIPDEIGLEEDDTLKPDYVSIGDGDGCAFWIIEEKEIKPRQTR